MKYISKILSNCGMSKHIKFIKFYVLINDKVQVLDFFNEKSIIKITEGKYLLNFELNI